jgi:hypothetical protein
MRARSKGVGVILAVGLVFAVAVPASARPASSSPAQQIVTRVAQTSSLTMKSGFSQYLYVGGTSADAKITGTSFHHIPDARCAWQPPRGIVHQTGSQGPVGPSSPASAEGSFTTSGDVAVIAGIGLKGYKVESMDFSPGGAGYCGETATGQPLAGGNWIGTGKVGGLVLILVGTNGVGNLVPGPLVPLFQNRPCPTTQRVTTLRNVTASMGANDGGAVGVFSVPLPPNSSCQWPVSGTSFNEPNVDYSMWSQAYVLVPTTK